MAQDSSDKSTMAGGESIVHSLIYKGLLIITYLGLNISLNMANKWILSHFGFHFPLFISMVHMGFSFLALAPMMVLPSFRELHMPTLRKQWFGLVGVGLFFAVNIGFNNVSLISISLSLNQVIRASIPVVTAVGAIFIENKKPTQNEFISLLVLVFGVMLAVYEGSSDKSSLYGIVICLIGTVSNGLMMTCSGRLMSEKIDVLRLTFYTSPISGVALAPFFFQMENAKLQEYTKTADNKYLGLLLLTCFMALAYNLVHYLMIKVTSSVTTTVLGEMKIIMILVLSAALLGENKIWTFKMFVGCTTAILGFCMYSHCKLSAHAPAPQIKGVPELSPSLNMNSVRAPLLGKQQST